VQVCDRAEIEWAWLLMFAGFHAADVTKFALVRRMFPILNWLILNDEQE